MSKSFNALFMGASYGSLLPSKLVLAGHNAILVYLPDEVVAIAMASCTTYPSMPAMIWSRLILARFQDLYHLRQTRSDWSGRAQPASLARYSAAKIGK